MTVAEYAAKYGVTDRAVYHAVYDGRLPKSYNGACLDIPDIPFPDNGKMRRRAELYDLPDYILSLIWFTGSITGDAIVIRHQDQELHNIIRAHIRASAWSRESTLVTKINGVEIVSCLRELGFSGKKDAARIPPSTDPREMAKAYFETHTSFTRELRHDRHNPGRENASYHPAITFCASAPIIDALVLALCSLGVSPMRKISPAANGTSATIKYTSHSQLTAMHSLLSPDLGSGTNAAFWDRFDAHICTPPVPYNLTKQEQQLRDDETLKNET